MHGDALQKDLYFTVAPVISLSVKVLVLQLNVVRVVESKYVVVWTDVGWRVIDAQLQAFVRIHGAYRVAQLVEAIRDHYLVYVADLSNEAHARGQLVRYAHVLAEQPAGRGLLHVLHDHALLQQAVVQVLAAKRVLDLRRLEVDVCDLDAEVHLVRRQLHDRVRRAVLQRELVVRRLRRVCILSVKVVVFT